MRVNRPDGISQENRSHPFFIMLRGFTGDQKSKAEEATVTYIEYGIVTILSIVLIMVCTMVWIREMFLFSLVVCLAVGCLCNRRYYDLRAALSNTVFREVDQMIYTNMYQLSNLNMEDVINKMTKCASCTGVLERFIRETKYLILVDIALVVGAALCVIWKVVFYV